MDPNIKPYQEKWTVERTIGKGAYGKVQLIGTDTNIKCVVKIIRLHHDKEAGEKMVSAENNLRKLSHENIVKYLWSERSQDSLEFRVFMEFLSGVTLSKLAKDKQLTEDEIACYGYQICSALDYLHSRKPAVLHRDIKGDNVMVLTDSSRIKLVDFGLSFYLKSNDATHHTGSAFEPEGTLRFMAPELFGAESEDKMLYSRKSDIWAFGCTLYEMATGSVPYSNIFQLAFPEKLKKDGAPPLPDQCSPQLKTIYSFCVAQRREDRKSAAQLLQIFRTSEIATRLQLQQWLPNMISFQDSVRATDVGDPAREGPAVQSIEKLAWKVFRGILACAWTARETFVKVNETVKPNPTTPSAQLSDSESDSDEESSDSVNPMDVLHLCFLCCDAEVQQILCRALFSCKLAFPLVYYDSAGSLTLSKWALRDIVVEFRDKQDRHVETSLVSDHRFPIVSFARIGDLSMSKSKLLNSLLGNSSHATFFHRDRVNGDVRRRCSNGMIEAAVFLPSECKSAGQQRSFDRALILTNMRGDLMQFEAQAQVIADISDIAVLFFADADRIQNEESQNLIKKLQVHAKVLVIVCRKPKAKKSKTKSDVTDLKSLFNQIPYIEAFKGKKEKNGNP